MTRTRRIFLVYLLWTSAASFQAPSASAQIVEAVGSRALGMGGAFVGVANDSSATWWNPAGLAAGQFFDLSLGWASADRGKEPLARRGRSTWAAVVTPPVGFSYYRLKTTDMGAFRPIAPDDGGREDRRAAVPAWALSASQVGVTLVHTLVSGLHAGTTLKYVRVSGGFLDEAGRLDAGDSRGTFDLDIGVLAVHRGFRVGGVVRNARQIEAGPVILPRQVRLGAAWETDAGTMPVTLALDADARVYRTLHGDRRVVAVGGEGWAFARRVGVRAGARFNTVGSQERAVTAGASFAVRSSVFVEGFVVHGRARDEHGWGIAARASF